MPHSFLIWKCDWEGRNPVHATVFLVKYIETISVSMVKVNCCNEKKQYIVMLPKYVGKVFTKELIQ